MKNSPSDTIHRD